jgi:hypothetical protein
LSVLEDVQPVADHINNVLPLAREYGLSLMMPPVWKLSIRYGAPLATLDDRLRKLRSRPASRFFHERVTDAIARCGQRL